MQQQKKELLIIKRDWDNAEIKIEMDSRGVRVECPIVNFERKLEAAILAALPQAKKKLFGLPVPLTAAQVQEAFRKAFLQVTFELKKETAKVAA